MNKVDYISNVQDKIYDRYGVNSAPFGDKYIRMVLDMAAEILQVVKPAEINDDIVNGLTENNAHMATHAAELLKHLELYAGYQYLH